MFLILQSKKRLEDRFLDNFMSFYIQIICKESLLFSQKMAIFSVFD